MDPRKKGAGARQELQPGRKKAFDRAFLHDYGAIEARRALRFNTVFSVLLVSTDPSLGEEGREAVAGAVLASTRNCDVAAQLDGTATAVLLPETDHFGALISIRKIEKAIAALSEDHPGFRVLISHATYPSDGASFEDLLEAASVRTGKRKTSLRQTLSLDDTLFWEVVGSIFGTAYRGFENASFDAGGGHELTEFFIDQVNELIINEVRGFPQRKGVLYLTSKRITPELPVVKALRETGMTRTRIFLVGEYERELLDLKNATPVNLGDPRLKDTFFTFFLTEESGYALILKENWGATFSCFHTSDEYLVEGLIHKFQKEYALQEQLG